MEQYTIEELYVERLHVLIHLYLHNNVYQVNERSYVLYLHIAAMSHVGNSYIHSAPALYGGAVGETSSNMGCIRVPSLCRPMLSMCTSN